MIDSTEFNSEKLEWFDSLWMLMLKRNKTLFWEKKRKVNCLHITQPEQHGFGNLFIDQFTQIKRCKYFTDWWPV